MGCLLVFDELGSFVLWVGYVLVCYRVHYFVVIYVFSSLFLFYCYFELLLGVDLGFVCACGFVWVCWDLV